MASSPRSGHFGFAVRSALGERRLPACRVQHLAHPPRGPAAPRTHQSPSTLSTLCESRKPRDARKARAFPEPGDPKDIRKTSIDGEAPRPYVRRSFPHGLWLSLVERFVRDEEAAGSNPASPIPFSKES